MLAARHTQDLEGNRPGLDQDITVFIDDRGHDGMLTARQVIQLDHQTAAAIARLPVFTIDVQNNHVAGLKRRLD